MYAINLGSDNWFIANKVDASRYGPREPAGEVWSEQGTTAFLGRVGEEARCVELGDHISFLQGYAAAYKNVLGHCLKNLGYGEEKLARLAVEREEALVALHRLCEKHGDLEWDRDLHLADIVDKHLGKHLDKLRDDVGLYMRYLGVLQLLGDASAYLPKEGDLREQIENALDDATKTYGVSVRRVLNRYDIGPGVKR
jgi:hypothetical protein